MDFNSKILEKKIIIVYGKNEQVYANLLFGLIGEVAKYECVIWSEKEFEQNNFQVSSSNKVIFIGNSKYTSKIIPNLHKKFNNFGMNFGWLGNRGVIYVNETPMDKDEYERFWEYSKQETEDFNKLINDMDSIATKSVYLLPFVLGPVYSGISLISYSIYYFRKKNKIKEQQYNVVVRKFFTNGLSKFMGI
jgi:hypothetical protein